jgi:murein L,D-transpeptidase YcbB/YkuD
VEYKDYDLFNKRLLSRRVVVLRKNNPLMQIKVKSIEDNPSWRKPPFFIKVPKGMSAEWVSGDTEI